MKNEKPISFTEVCHKNIAYERIMRLIGESWKKKHFCSWFRFCRLRDKVLKSLREYYDSSFSKVA